MAIITREELSSRALAAYKSSYKLAIVGAIAFWLAAAATRLVVPDTFGFTPTPLFSAGILFRSVVVGLSVSYYLVLYFDKIPSKSPILKSVILSIIALVIFGGITTLFYFDEALNFILEYFLYNVAAFAASGVVIGLVYQKLYQRQSPLGTTSS